MKLRHEPIRPARAGHPEASFLATWQQLIAGDDELFEEIFDRLPYKLDQRGASVAASFTCWLGTSAGAGLLRHARELISEELYEEEAYVTAWALHNRRQGHINGNVRSIEFLLARESLAPTPQMDAKSEAAYRKLKVTLADLDVIEAVLEWLTDSRGKRFLAAAEARADADEKQRRAISHTEAAHG